MFQPQLNVLILEDDRELARTLQLFLQKKLSVQVKYTSVVEKAIKMIDLEKFDVAIVDWILEDDETGLEFINYAHEYHPQLKILMLTRQAQTARRIQAYRTGADYYLTKPFSGEELLIKIKKMINQFKLCDEQTFCYQEITLYSRSGKLLLKDQAVSIRPKEAAILEVLIAHQPRVLTKQQLVNYVWPDFSKQPNTNTIEVYIKRIRHKLGQYGCYLKNKRGYGYCLNKGKEQ